MQGEGSRHLDWSIFQFRWQPSAELALVVLTWIAVVAGLWTAFQGFTTQRVALNFITFGPISIFGLGVAVPILLIIRNGRSLKAVGITSSRAVLSIVLSLLFAVIQYTQTMAGVGLPALDRVIPLVTMALAVGLFEAIFFRGWIQLRLEAAFGAIPGICFGSLFYALYHVGHGMAPGEIAFLFVIGLIYAVVFRLTRNILILWPFLTPMGGLFSNIKDGLTLPFEATYGFLLVLGLMFAFILSVTVYMRRKAC